MSEKNKLRYNIISAFIYIIGIVLLIQLFNLQIVQGESYKEQSNTRLTRESVLQSARGNIKDSSGTILAGTVLGNDVQLYKTKIEDEELNTALLKLTQILEKNGDTYVDELPIKVEPYEFTVTEEEAKQWKEKNKLEKSKTAEECFKYLKEKYKIDRKNII